MRLNPGDHVTVSGVVIKVENGCALIKSNGSDTKFWISDKDITTYRPMDKKETI